ncbi:MAG: hypothetical protein GX793_05975 [Bacteroidales bacterium]|nr:hypothetical protein [Bacteroidales bacterium]MCK9499768.1 hypothetical protein [Bacteroidales bacterium]MDY0315710.1 hypothetical protein [Bacteroidales bacterium]NLB86589.1 hypothetical protein [Bacteroidales bacterium]
MNHKKNNYFGIKEFALSSIDENLKYTLSKLLCLSPSVSSIEARQMALETNTDKKAELLIQELEIKIKKTDKILLEMKVICASEEWISKNGPLTLLELFDLRDYYTFSVRSFVNKLLAKFDKIQFKNKEHVMFLLKEYHLFIDEEYWDIILDKYLDLNVVA